MKTDKNTKRSTEQKRIVAGFFAVSRGRGLSTAKLVNSLS